MITRDSVKSLNLGGNLEALPPRTPPKPIALYKVQLAISTAKPTSAPSTSSTFRNFLSLCQRERMAEKVDKGIYPDTNAEAECFFGFADVPCCIHPLRAHKTDTFQKR